MRYRWSTIWLGVAVCFAAALLSVRAVHAAVPDDALKAFVRGYLAPFTGATADLTTRIAVARIPNDDVVVFIWGQGWCGTGGCQLLILKRAGGAFQILGQETIVRPPIRLLASRVNGEPQIGVTECGGGITRCYEAALSFDGHAYPSNPSMPPAKALKGREGSVIISGDAFSRKGSTLLYDSPHTKRVVNFAGGRARIDRHGAEEHVVVELHGRIEAVSDCDATSGTYDQSVRFATAIKKAAQADDRNALAARMLYPLQVNVAPGKSYFVPTKAALLAHFASVFNAQVLGKLSRLEPHDVFCRNEQTMLADGTLWASVGFDGVLRATVVNVMPF